MASTFRYCRQCLRPLRRAAIQSPARSYSSATFSAARHGEDVLITTVKRVPLARPFSRATSPIFSQTTQRATLTSSAHRPRAIINPRKDDEGNDMDIEITQRAASRLKQIATSDRNPDVALRITVESGGCHGFQYLMSLTDMTKVSEAEDTVFEGSDGAKVVMDEPSLELLKGSKVDYTMELIGSQFKVINPLATSSCGCGTSFDIKMA